VEPFCGSAAIFFNKPKAKINVLNDLDADVTYQLDLLMSADSDPSLYPHDLKTLSQLKEFYQHHPDTIEGELVAEKIAVSTGFCNLPVHSVKEIYNINNPWTTLRHLSDYQEMLEDVTISHNDAFQVIEQYDSPETFFFIDPPYENSQKHYYDGHHSFDYDHLAHTLKQIQGKFILTINQSPQILNFFQNFSIETTPLDSGWYHKNPAKIRNDLLIKNF